MKLFLILDSRKTQPTKTFRNADKNGFSMKDIFPLSIVPKPIMSMQNMFSFSKSNPSRKSSKLSQKSTNKTLWRQLDDSPEPRPMKPKHHYGAKSNGFSRLYTFDEKKQPSRKPIFMPKPSSISNQQNIEPIKRDNHFRTSAVALFGGNADYGWKKVMKQQTTSKPKAKFNLEETIKRQTHLNSVINAYKNNSLTSHGLKHRKNLVKNFSQNMRLEYHNQKTKMDADDALSRSQNSDHTKPFNHQ